MKETGGQKSPVSIPGFSAKPNQFSPVGGIFNDFFEAMIVLCIYTRMVSAKKIKNRFNETEGLGDSRATIL
jgi:hypothetical protein